MAKILLSLISDQPAPNLFLLMDYRFQDIDQYFFITTPEMEQKGRADHLILAANLSLPQCHRVVVHSDNILDVKKHLTRAGLEHGQHEYLINLTGGTKMMSLAVFDFFSDTRYNTKMFYLPFGKQVFRQIYPADTFQEIELLPLQQLSPYLKSYGLIFDETIIHLKPTQSLDYSKAFLEKYLDKHKTYTLHEKTFGEYISAIRKTQNKFPNQTLILSKIKMEGLVEFLKEIDFSQIKPRATFTARNTLSYWRLVRRMGLQTFKGILRAS